MLWINRKDQLYWENKLLFRLYFGFPTSDFPESTYVALPSHALQTALSFFAIRLCWRALYFTERNSFSSVSRLPWGGGIFLELHTAHLRRLPYCVCAFRLVASITKALRLENEIYFSSRSRVLFDGYFCHRVLPNSH